MRVLVVNSGSSSIRFALFDPSTLQRRGCGLFDRIGSERASYWREGADGVPQHETMPRADHRRCLERLFETVPEMAGPTGPSAIGHRVVHGGDRFRSATLVDARVREAIAECDRLAPTHNPLNRLGIEVAGRYFPDTAQVAVFDTAFHQSMPAVAHRYALPEEVTDRYGIRRYGFHGTSHQFLARRAARELDIPLGQSRFVTLHLGNGASAAAIRHGRSVDTSMGMTPLAGLVMGSRCGDLDPAVVLHLQRECGMRPEDVEVLLNECSGLRGLAGVNDMREIHSLRAGGNHRAGLAFELFCYRVRHYVGAYLAVLGGADAVVFSGGIGENDPAVREECLSGLESLGLSLDAVRNRSARDGSGIHRDGSRIRVLVLRSDEEYEIARQTIDVVPGVRQGSLSGDESEGDVR